MSMTMLTILQIAQALSAYTLVTLILPGIMLHKHCLLYTSPRMNLGKVNRCVIVSQKKCKVTQKAYAKTTVQIVLEHMVNHVECIFRWRKNRIISIVNSLHGWRKCVCSKNIINNFIYRSILI